jgi:hypothetical protein
VVDGIILQQIDVVGLCYDVAEVIHGYETQSRVQKCRSCRACSESESDCELEPTIEIADSLRRCLYSGRSMGTTLNDPDPSLFRMLSAPKRTRYSFLNIPRQGFRTFDRSELTRWRQTHRHFLISGFTLEYLCDFDRGGGSSHWNIGEGPLLFI